MALTSRGSLPRDNNDVPVAGAIRDDGSGTIDPWKVDPTSGRVLISATIAGLGTQVLNEVVSGSGTSWTLAHTPNSAGVALYANGQRLTPTTDYTLAVATITTSLSWVAGTVIADYQY